MLSQEVTGLIGLFINIQIQFDKSQFMLFMLPRLRGNVSVSEDKQTNTQAVNSIISILVECNDGSLNKDSSTHPMIIHLLIPSAVNGGDQRSRTLGPSGAIELFLVDPSGLSGQLGDVIPAACRASSLWCPPLQANREIWPKRGPRR